MKINLLPLINETEKVLLINEEIEIPLEYYEKTDIKRMSKVMVKGSIDDIGNNIYNIKLKVRGTMILPCALSLEDVDNPFEIDIDENVGFDEEFEESYRIISNSLDILPILWYSIVLEIPSKVIKKNVSIETEGDGWCLITDEIKEEEK